ncbi:MAG: GTP-binding protein, partial [Chitinophagaceae bacterium]
GSCTDIIATVIKPLQKFHPELKIILSVFADATILLNMAEDIPFCFDDDVNYIYEKQLEEADLLVINKKDLLDDLQLQSLKKKVNKAFSHKKTVFQNSLKENDIEQWLNMLDNFDSNMDRNSLEINYDKYGAGEAKLAWLDDEVKIISETGDANELAVRLINCMYEKIQQKNHPIGHLKFFIKAGGRQRKISFTSLLDPKLKQTPSFIRLEELDLLINARIQTDPERLKAIFSAAIKEVSRKDGDKIISKSLSVFQPGYPKPEHRIEN